VFSFWVNHGKVVIFSRKAGSLEQEILRRIHRYALYGAYHGTGQAKVVDPASAGLDTPQTGASAQESLSLQGESNLTFSELSWKKLDKITSGILKYKNK